MRCLTLLSILIMTGLTLPGCQTTTIEPTLTGDGPAGQTIDSQLDFWHELTDRPLVANDEAFHALLLFVDGQDNSADYTQRVATLKDRHMLPAGFDAPANAPIARGNLAMALVVALDIKGGLLQRLTGNHPRYATRELIYEGIYPSGSEHQTFSGRQFVALIAQAEDYLQTHSPTPGSAPAPGSNLESDAESNIAPGNNPGSNPESDAGNNVGGGQGNGSAVISETEGK